ncbi:2Fe-2S iron-sulfur cluster-binding protein [Massilia sp. TS11]|uniref:2Fe-2S iron-sulfur cluster-binding protein n=1 Tax=Massilia sp. TS11 TaxID=2908003 RepID=UPI001EDC3007|nr:2Fe-2S iron-sulfur cluster-binding protein [Massilia sp. TS11]MCG2584297.1 2Fe-2S iron-sulfur cluster-binding protein [Massilia sp. TS11]
MRIALAEYGWEFVAAPGQSLLEAAEAAGIVLPSSCRNGTCRTCLAQVLSGSARHRIDWPGLSLEEKRAGWVLPCVADACSDLELAVSHARRAAAP